MSDLEHPARITRLLEEANAGSREAVDQAFCLIYEQLHRLALDSLRRERHGHTLQPTALVNEAYLSLVKSEPPGWKGRVHFFATAATALRNVLVQHARRRGRRKRGGGLARETLKEDAIAALHERAPVIELDEALRSLGRLDPQKERIVELRFFAGLTVEEVAGLLQVSASTVARDWRVARAWLRKELDEEVSDGP